MHCFYKLISIISRPLAMKDYILNKTKKITGHNFISLSQEIFNRYKNFGTGLTILRTLLLDSERDSFELKPVISGNIRKLIDHLEINKFSFCDDELLDEGTKYLFFGIRSNSNPIFIISDCLPAINQGIILGKIKATPELSKIVSDISTNSDLDKSEIFLSDFYKSVWADDLKTRLLKISKLHQHMAPVIYKNNSRVITNFYLKKVSHEHDNEIRISEYLNDLVEISFDAWNQSDKDFIACLLILSEIGVQTVYEEFNSQELTLSTLYTYLVEKIEYLSGGKESRDMSQTIEIARDIGKCREKRLSDSFYYRYIDGVSLNKIEKFSDKIGDFDRPMPQGCIEFFSSYGISCSFTSELYDASRSLFKSSLMNSNHAKEGFTSSAEALINEYLKSTLRIIESDIVMTRGFTRLSDLLSLAKNNEYQKIIDYKQTDYFCYVLPSNAVVKNTDPKMLQVILNSISARMRFNSWHYLPGNYSEDISGERDYFIPPVLSDIALNSDLHHPGHIHSRVKYSIRCPESVTINNKVYKAFIDLRLMRMNGSVFTLEELKRSKEISLNLQTIYQALIDHLEETNSSFSFNFATKKWYLEKYQNKEEKEVALA